MNHRTTGSARHSVAAAAWSLLLCTACSTTAQEAFPDSQLTTLAYNNPGLVVDLGVGLWGHPLPMDIDGDGQFELMVGWGGRPNRGVNLYQRLNDDPRSIVFKAGQRISDYTGCLQTSYTLGQWFALSPGKLYPDFPKQGLDNAIKLPFDPPFYTYKRFTVWRYYDFDEDGSGDLLIAASNDNASDTNYFNEKGQWQGSLLDATYYWVRNTGNDEKPAFDEAPIQIMAGDEPMRTLNLTGPNFADFDGDGLNDIIGSDGLDAMSFFKNVGKPGQPRFAAGKPLSNGGQVIRMDLEMIEPSCVDYDQDGDFDLLVAEEDGRVSLLTNTGKVEDGVPVFDLPRFLQEEAAEVKFGVLVTPFGYDLDNDGDTDLVCGNTAGYFGFIENLGGQPIRWAKPVYLKADGEVIHIQAGPNGSTQGPEEAKWGYTVLSVADWDGDGLGDLITNDIWGKVTWFRHVGGDEGPTFAAGRPIQVQWEGKAPKPAWHWWDPQGNDLVTQWRSSVQAIDLTGDGLCDLVALDVDGYLVMHERKQVDGKLVLLPGRRVFHMVDDQPNVYDAVQNPLFFDENNDGINDLAVLDDQGRLGFQGWKTVDGKREVAIVERIDRSDDPRYKDLGNLTALRLTAGWAGRGGRRKFLLTDWDRDGKLDLLVNSFNINFLHNEATEPGKFVFRDMGQMDSLRLAGHTTCPAVMDLNGDGIEDLVIGAEDGRFYCLPNPKARKAD